ncbi:MULTISPECIES: GNAT family N-acetyltransferase [unclassified Corynebacterium]|uniref:GNAT family N-acetyltransferase n=1 Tax=Corynebacterium TaxID=1716 RepID=UPI000A98D077|nr:MULTISPECIES: GNAT family N-acetyltransferase [unclassified Corynebacterium]MBS5997736.1 N-acetyltransferase [Corynebacterium sp.]MDU1462973.1 GNAT family N-acetyltransferase [Corynebacterium sp.]MDU5017890.1 GNAT family N-acetyltransferase [Corynebacterium sp.]MDU7102208.1 GNAT family N-acetyltransferase [Corynebacterium sp.]
MEHAIAHQTDKSRYVLTVDGVEAGACHYVDAGTTREFNHTVIKDAFRGQGLSAPLIKAALDDARGVGKQVIASCSAVAHFIEKNPEYRDLLRPEGM